MPQSAYGAKLTRVSRNERASELLILAHSIKPSAKRSPERRFVSCTTATCRV